MCGSARRPRRRRGQSWAASAGAHSPRGRRSAAPAPRRPAPPRGAHSPSRGPPPLSVAPSWRPASKFVRRWGEGLEPRRTQVSRREARLAPGRAGCLAAVPCAWRLGELLGQFESGGHRDLEQRGSAKQD